MYVDAIQVASVTHAYGNRTALDQVSFEVHKGEVFGLLGPNGGGKTTLFKILSTLMRPGSGDAIIGGHSVLTAAHAVRRQLGVVFQHPGLDGKLTVAENLRCHGQLYRLSGEDLEKRITASLERLGLDERSDDYAEALSGGLQRRVELAKALLHRPPILLLDEPSTGLDPGARRDFLYYLRQLAEAAGVTVVLTTHYMEEAERCDRVAILDRGTLVRLGTPSELKDEVGGDVVVLQATDPSDLRRRIQEQFGFEATLFDGSLRIEQPRGHELVRDLVEAYPGEISGVTFGKPTLEDVFVHATGNRFWNATTPEVAA